MDEERNPNIEIAIRYIQDNYSPLGTDKDYVTSADIVRELSEMCSVSIADITKLMDSGGFKVEFLEGKPFWVVHRK